MMLHGLSMLAAALSAVWAATWLLRWGPRLLRAYRRHFTRQARQRMDALFLARDLSGLWRPVLLLGAGVMAGAYVTSRSWWLAALLGLSVCTLPHGVAQWAWRRRARQLEAQLPALLLTLAWALRAGSSLPGALRAAVAETPAPLRQELALLLREQRMGLTFELALAGLHQRVPTPAVALVVAVLGMAAHAGGQVADTVQGLAETLAQQWRAHMRLRSVTAQSLMQARIMTGLPVLLLAVLQWLEPDAMAGLWQTPRGWGVLALLALLLGSGAYWLHGILRLPR